MTYVLCHLDYQIQYVYKSKGIYSDEGEYLDYIEGWYPETVCTSPVIITNCESEDEQVLRDQAIRRNSKRSIDAESWSEYFPVDKSRFSSDAIRRGYQ